MYRNDNLAWAGPHMCCIPPHHWVHPAVLSHLGCWEVFRHDTCQSSFCILPPISSALRGHFQRPILLSTLMSPDKGNLGTITFVISYSPLHWNQWFSSPWGLLSPSPPSPHYHPRARGRCAAGSNLHRLPSLPGHCPCKIAIKITFTSSLYHLP